MDRHKANPWRTLESEVKYENPWIRLREDRVIQPDGTPGVYAVAYGKKLAVGVLAIDSNEEITLVGQYRYAIDCYSWEIVAGGADEREEPLQAAKRELREEAGLTASTWTSLGGIIYLGNSSSNKRCTLYLAQGLNTVPLEPEPTEIITVNRVTVPAALSMIQSGEIHDAMTIMAILQLELFHRRKKT